MSRPRSAVRHALTGACRANPRAAWMTVFWTGVSSMPVFLHGRAVANALDDGFLAGDRVTGLKWLTVLAVASLVAAVGAARAVKSVGGLVEPFRDRLVEFVVDEALESATAPGGRPNSGAVARLSQQIEVVRGALGAAVLGLLGFVVTVASTLVGQATLSTDVLVLVIPPLAVALVIFSLSLPLIIRRERALVAGGEQVAAGMNATMEGLRDIQVAGAQDSVRAEVGAAIDDQARLGRSVAAVTAWRIAVVGVGARLPVVLILVGIPWLVRNGATPGNSERRTVTAAYLS